MRSFARYDIPDADRAVTLEQAAARGIGCAESDDSDHDRTSILPWVLGCLGFWLIVALAVWS